MKHKILIDSVPPINNPYVKPIMRWAGGKTQLLDEIVLLLPNAIETYCEPFVGGGAVLFALKPNSAYVNDLNEDLICLYEAVRDDVDALVEEVESYPRTPDFFYSMRGLDRNRQEYDSMPKIQKAARMLYLNRSCYNGLYRTNRKGEFNSPFAGSWNSKPLNEQRLRAVGAYFNHANIRFFSTDFESFLDAVPSGSFVYLDPPYDSDSNGSFTGYTKFKFGKDDQIRLRKCCDELNSRGSKFMLSNAATDFVLEQYSNYNVVSVFANRTINSDAGKRKKVEEVIIRNYS